MKLIKNKKFITIFSSILLSVTMLASIFVVLFNSIKSNEPTEASTKSAKSSVYTFTDARITYDVYNTHDTFYINDATGYLGFIKCARYTIGDYGAGNRGCWFKYKTVILTADITLYNFKFRNENNAIEYIYLEGFEGTFDGGGHSITFNYKSDGSDGWGFGIDENKNISPFCIINKGTIKNLKLINADVYSGASGNCGMIAAYNEGTIESCIVENCRYFYYARNKGEVSFGPICGENNGIVKNCIATGTAKFCYQSISSSSSYKDKLTASCFVGKGDEAENCIYNMTISYDEDSFYNVKTNQGALSGYGNATGTNAYTNITNKTDPFLINSQSGPLEAILFPTAYFKYQDSSHGGINGVYLRVFIPWTEYSIQAQDGGYVTKDKAYNPRSHATVNVDNENKMLTFYDGTEVTANNSSSHNFIGWTNSGNTYIAQFEPKKVKLTFVENENCTCVGMEEYELKYNTTISISISATWDNGTTKEITFTFKNAANEDCTVSYEAGAKWIIDFDMLSNGDAITSSMEISVETILKQYGVII